MKHWWERNSEVDLGGYTRNKVEDLTGCIPLLLDYCVKDNTINLNHEFFVALYDQARTSERNIRKLCKNDEESWNEYDALVLPL